MVVFSYKIGKVLLFITFWHFGLVAPSLHIDAILLKIASFKNRWWNRLQARSSKLVHKLIYTWERFATAKLLTCKSNQCNRLHGRTLCTST